MSAPPNTQQNIPTYIYKILPSSSPPATPLPDALPVSDLDKKDSFIHLSTSVQLPGTLSRFFESVDVVYILRLEYKKVEEDIRWEDPKGQNLGEIGGERVYPHLYNGLRLGGYEIDSFQRWDNCGEGWDVAILKAKSDGWFRY